MVIIFTEITFIFIIDWLIDSCTDTERRKHIRSCERNIQDIGTFQSSELGDMNMHGWHIQNPWTKSKIIQFCTNFCGYFYFH